MRTRDLARHVLFASLLTTLPGCYLAHERPAPAATSTIDPNDLYAAASAPRPAPTAAGCGASTFAPLAPMGLEDIRNPTLTAIDGGFVASVVHASPLDYPTAVGRMRGDLTAMLDVPHEAGIVTSGGGEVMRAAMSAGDDGRLASCVVSSTDDAGAFVPGGVAFFDQDGVLEQIVRFGYRCSDVAWVDGRWVAVEVAYPTNGDAPRDLVVFDAALAITRRIDLAYASAIATLADRVVDLNGLVIVAGPYGTDAERLTTIDLETGFVRSLDFPFAPPVALTASQLALVAHGGHLAVAWIDRDGNVWWATLDDTLTFSDDAVSLGTAGPFTGFIDARPIDGGVVLAWASGTGASEPITIALVADDGTPTLVHPTLPPSVSSTIETLQLAVQGDVVAIALDADSPDLFGSTVGIWSARCRAR